jgi:hypothetical protein
VRDSRIAIFGSRTAVHLVEITAVERRVGHSFFA